MVFRHGPGAVAERLDSVERYYMVGIPERILSCVPLEQFQPVWSLQTPVQADDVPARVIAVPKTAKKPRLISIEPSYNQFAQQGYLAVLAEELDKMRICSFADQTPNQILALRGSKDGSVATIDLSEASDRVSWGLVRSLFSWNSNFVRILEATRSRVVQLPSGDELVLNKFASMGSALTFPIEVMVFTSIVISAICEYERNHSRSYIRSLAKRSDIRVYGDDIIVPTQYYPIVTRYLEEYGLKVNMTKSFHKGDFRESCGVDAYDGVDITPVYVRRRLPSSRRDVSELVSLVSFRNQWVARRGYNGTTDLLDRWIRDIIPFPAVTSCDVDPKGRVAEAGPILGRVGPCDLVDFSSSEYTWNTNLMKMEVSGFAPVPKRRPTRACDAAVLIRSLARIQGGFSAFRRSSHTVHLRSLAKASVGSFDPQHLTHHGRPQSAKLKLRRASIN